MGDAEASYRRDGWKTPLGNRQQAGYFFIPAAAKCRAISSGARARG